MAIRCRNGETWPNVHFHDHVSEVRLCYGGKSSSIAGPFVASAAAPPAPAATLPKVGAGSSTRQHRYIADLGGDVARAKKMTWDEAHEYINELESQRKTTRRNPVEDDPRFKMVTGMIDRIPDGYYATAADGEGGHVDFVRVTRTVKSTRKFPAGTLKIQTQHSDLWKVAMVKWPNGNWSTWDRRVLDSMMLVISDHKTCARRYGIELQHCQKCNKQLTDDRSRHYLIGPECETKYGGDVVIQEVDDLNDGLSFEQLVARGKPTRVWQEAVT